MTDLAEDLARHEDNIEADCVPLAPPPFAPGDRVVQRARPESGLLIVTGSRRWTYGHWRIEASQGASTLDAPADGYVLAPRGWTDPPPRPVSAREQLDNSTDGPITDAQYAAAREADAERVVEQVDWCLAMKFWHEHVAALIDPDRAARAAAGFARLALLLTEETER